MQICRETNFTNPLQAYNFLKLNLNTQIIKHTIRTTTKLITELLSLCVSFYSIAQRSL